MSRFRNCRKPMRKLYIVDSEDSYGYVIYVLQKV